MDEGEPALGPQPGDEQEVSRGDREREDADPGAHQRGDEPPRPAGDGHWKPDDGHADDLREEHSTEETEPGDEQAADRRALDVLAPGEGDVGRAHVGGGPGEQEADGEREARDH